MEEFSNTWAIYSAGILAVLSFLITVSERIQKLLGPIGSWFSARKTRAVNAQRELEVLIEQRLDNQIAVLIDEADMYRERNEKLITEMNTILDENLRLAQTNAQLKRLLAENGLCDGQDRTDTQD
ncbi:MULTISPECIES: hypothetical protein [Corynebacterium]|uniref:hypothetical protein n=1 Tax=Corynebacterium TaxID=1716 RepID=UPI001178395E|nr:MULTISPECIES: hypothetical protein [Corynebacterium]MDK8896950.1 hypothetical protein [Corynebacterium sp. MSK004]TRX42547.1 hypothetical protein FNY89_03365 [Corynebacterium guaraldiae]TRX51517.1 hypothetical protein FNY91_09375 [Corynebacterium guaraldiae]